MIKDVYLQYKLWCFIMYYVHEINTEVNIISILNAPNALCFAPCTPSLDLNPSAAKLLLHCLSAQPDLQFAMYMLFFLDHVCIQHNFFELYVSSAHYFYFPISSFLTYYPKETAYLSFNVYYSHSSLDVHLCCVRF